MFRKIGLIFGIVFVSVFLISLAFFSSYLFFVWSGFPVGGDAPQHLFRFRFVNEFFPYYHWIHLWAGGMPQFLWYPAAPYLILSAILRLIHQSPEFSLTFTAVLAISLSGIGIYLLTWEITKNRLASLLGAILYLILPSSWLLIHAAVYARTIATPLMIFALWGFVRFWKHYQKGEFRKNIWILTTALLGLSLIFHFAVGVFTCGIIFIFGLISSRKSGEFFKEILKLFSVSALLSAIFWLPTLFFKMPGFKAGQDVLAAKQPTVFWKDLVFWQNPQYINQFQPFFHFLPFFVLISLALLIIIALIFRRSIFSRKDFAARAIYAFLGLFILSLIYAQFPIKSLSSFYSNVWPPLWTVYFYPLFLGPLIGIFFAKLFNLRWQIVLILPILFGLGWWLLWLFPLKDQLEAPYRKYEQTQEHIFFDKVSKKFISNQKQFNYRFGDDNFGWLAGWFNNNNLDIPQTREYFYLAILKPDQYFYMNYAIWNIKDNFNETNFLLDWWAIKQFVVGVENNPNVVEGKFESHPEDYQSLGDFKNDLTGPGTKSFPYVGFEYNSASPILSATDSPALLVIGNKQKAYTLIFKSLAYADLNSQKVIPVWGGERIDALDINKLKKFPIIILYNYKYKNQSKADKILKEYLENGGKVIVEANKEGQTISLDTFPVANTALIQISQNWDFKLSDEGREELSEINLNEFGKPEFDGGPWGVLIAGQLKSGAKPLLFVNDQPIIVKQNIGQGQIIWSGLNLPYHTITYQNSEESKFFGKLLGISTEKEKISKEVKDFEVKFINPQKREITIKNPDLRGILFKEFYFPNWRANSLKIYPAGPEFMYIPFEKGSVTKVVLEYNSSWVEKTGLIVSIITWLCLLFYLFGGEKLSFGLLLKNKLNLIKKRTTNWWDKEE